MKKKVLFIAAILTAGLSFGQDGMTSKKGTPILPEADDYAIGFDATNLLNYGGNFLNGSVDNGLSSLNLMQNNTLYGKMFVDANKAYRGMVNIGFGSNTATTLETDANDAAKMVENEAKSGNFNVAVGGGIEMRRGAGRLQGVYGPMAMISFGSSSTENTYGNQATSILRETATSSGSTIGLSLGGFAGIEYFFAPKMSLGAKVQWGINFSSTGAGETTSELFDGTNTTTTTAETGSSSAFGLGTTPNSMISLNFHF
jgi:hypothetical protein